MSRTMKDLGQILGVSVLFSILVGALIYIVYPSVVPTSRVEQRIRKAISTSEAHEKMRKEITIKNAEHAARKDKQENRQKEILQRLESIEELVTEVHSSIAPTNTKCVCKK